MRSTCVISRTWHALALAASLELLLWPVSLSAQDNVGAVEILRKDVALTTPWLSTLRAFAATGDSEALARVSREFLTELQSTLTGAPQGVCCDISKQYYLLLFTAYGLDGKAGLVPMLLHDPAPNGASLPGLQGSDDPLYQIFVAEDDAVTIQGYYGIERTENPALKQLGDFVNTIMGKVTLPTAIGRLPAEAQDRLLNVAPAPAPTRFLHTITLSKVEFPRDLQQHLQDLGIADAAVDEFVASIGGTADR
jgi:hypothetical protein